MKDIEEMTIGEAKTRIAEADELRKVFGIRSSTSESPARAGRSHSFHVGDAVLIRAVTFHYIGRIGAITDCDLRLDDAAWLACSDKWSKTLSEGSVSELEPYPGHCFLNREAIVDWSPWNHPLPREAV